MRAVEKLRKGWKEAGGKKQYPFEWVLGSFTPLPLLAYLYLKYKKLREHVDISFTSRVKELEENDEVLKTEIGSEINEIPEEAAAV